MHRKNILSATAMAMSLSMAVPVALPLVLLASCGSATNAATNLQMAQLYADDLSDAVSAAAQVYLAGPPAPNAAQATVVTGLISDLQTARKALDAATSATEARSIALQLLAAAQQLSPIVAAMLGGAAPYVPLAIAVVQAFVNALPPPPVAPATPPAGLHRAAMTYHGHH